MKLKLMIDPKYERPEIHLCNKEENAELRKLYQMVNAAVNTAVTGYVGDKVYMLAGVDIIRIYTEHQQVYAQTRDGRFRLHQRLYEMEEILDGSRFLRISNSEIVNLKKIKKLDTSITGTIRMYMAEDVETYVSRRYVTKIKKALGI